MANKYERKSIPKKVRFEVFKRDNFTCQYCGSKAPDVVLEVDHIEPVSKGGTNDVINLVTSCGDCNRGKSNIQLSDKAVIEQQREELEVLNERRKQLEMMVEWRNELMRLDEDKVEHIVETIEYISGSGVSETGIQNIKKWIKQFSLEIILDSVETSFDQYDDWEKAFRMIPKIAYCKTNPEKKLDHELKSITGIARNRFFNGGSRNDDEIFGFLKIASNHVSTDELKEVTTDSRHWEDVEDFVISRLRDGVGNGN